MWHNLSLSCVVILALCGCATPVIQPVPAEQVVVEPSLEYQPPVASPEEKAKEIESLLNEIEAALTDIEKSLAGDPPSRGARLLANQQRATIRYTRLRLAELGVALPEVRASFPSSNARGGQAEVTLESVGNRPLHVQSIAVIGHRDTAIVQSDNCSGAELQPGDHCTIRLQFNPHPRRPWAELQLNHDGQQDKTVVLLTAVAARQPGVATSQAGPRTQATPDGSSGPWNLQAQKALAEADLAAAQEELADAQEEFAEAQKKLTEAHTEIAAAIAAAFAVAASVDAVTLADSQANLAGLQEKLADSTTALTKAANELEYAAERLASEKEDLDRKQGKLSDLIQEFPDIGGDGVSSETRKKLKSAQNHLNEIQTLAQKHRDGLTAIASASNQAVQSAATAAAQTEATSDAKKLAESQSQLTTAQKELAEKQEELSRELRSSRNAAQLDLANAQSEIAKAQRELANKQSEVDSDTAKYMMIVTIAFLVAGLFLVTLTFVAAILVREPSAFQFWVFKTTFAAGLACIATAIVRGLIRLFAPDLSDAVSLGTQGASALATFVLALVVPPRLQPELSGVGAAGALKRAEMVGARVDTAQVPGEKVHAPDRSIFLSYRRSDSADNAYMIYGRLVARYGDKAVFKDVEDIPLGDDFRVHLDTALDDCKVVLVVIGPDWTGAEEGHDQRRIDDEKDFVHHEVRTALVKKIKVIPLLVRNARMPSDEQLPKGLEELAFMNGMEIRPGEFDRDMERLIPRIDEIVRGR